MVDFDIHHGNGTEAIVRNLIPHKERLPLPQSYAPVEVNSYKPWLDETDADNVFFASVHLHYPGFYPGDGGPCKSCNNAKLSSTCTPARPAVPRHIVNVALPQIGPIGLPQRAQLSPAQRAQLCKRASKTFREKIETEMLPKMMAFCPDLILLSSGFDGHHDDFYHWLTPEGRFCARPTRFSSKPFDVSCAKQH
jgi:acetoin utilization deacetylase AcuC-like enzyme